MPRGNPKRPTYFRLDPALHDAVVAHGMPLTEALEEGLRLFPAQQRRKAEAKPRPRASRKAT
jgi:hypothetical protein